MELCMMSATAGKVPPNEVIRIASECGLKAVEWITAHGSNGRMLKQMTADAGMKIAAYTMYDECFQTGEADYLEHFERNLEIALDAEAPLMMIPPFPLSPDRGLKNNRQAWIAYFQEVFPLARAAGMPLALESTELPDSPIVTSDEIQEVLDAVPGMKVVFDSGNTATGEDPLEAFEKLRQSIIHVHLKDNWMSDFPLEKGTRRRNGKYGRRAAIGSGNLELKRLYELLKSSGYSGWISLESGDPDQIRPITEVLKQNIQLIHSWK